MILASREQVYEALFATICARLKPEKSFRAAPSFDNFPACKSVLYQHQHTETPKQRPNLPPIWTLKVRVYWATPTAEGQAVKPIVTTINAFTDLIDAAISLTNPVRGVQQLGNIAQRVSIMNVSYWEFYTGGIWKGYYVDIETVVV